MIQTFLYNKMVVNTDNAEDAERLLSDPLTDRELTQEESAAIFGDFVHLAGPDSTIVNSDGNITFNKDKLPRETVDLSSWLDIIVRPKRNRRMDEFDLSRVNRCRREIEMGQTPTDELQTLLAYMQELADFPATLTAVVDPIPWPVPPVDPSAGGQA